VVLEKHGEEEVTSQVRNSQGEEEYPTNNKKKEG
jgi:hypothetical protein